MGRCYAEVRRQLRLESPQMIDAEALTREQARLIHRNAPTGIIGGFVVACVLASAFWSVSEHAHLGLWLAAGGLLSIYRLVVWRNHKADDFSVASARRWLRHAMVGAAISGCVWGAGTLVFFAPGDFVYHLIYVFAIAMMGVTAMFSYSAHYPTFTAFFAPTTIPGAVGMMMQGTWLHARIGLGVVIFMAVTAWFFASFNRMFVKSLQLGLENTNLVNELTLQKEAAEVANLAKSRFLAVASHDLRQPMHALTLYLGALDAHDLGDAARTNLANVRQCAHTMDEMFRALLDISRLDAGAIPTDMRAFAIEPVLDRLRIEFEPQARAKGIGLTVAPCAQNLDSDPDLVERILRNLISNAIRYTHQGRVLVACRKRATQLRVGVYDSGIGILPTEQRKIFDEFYQIANPERDRTKGIGLGLAIVARLAKLLDCPVSLTSRVGQGSVFAIDLPLAVGATARVADTASLSVPARANMAGLTILLVDDEAQILAVTRELLERWQCQVFTATSGAEALEKLAMSPRAPDAIICDYRLRNHETGIDVIEAVRTEFNADIPAIVVTGDVAPARMLEAQAKGMRVLHKPFNEQALRLALSQILPEAHATHQAA